MTQEKPQVLNYSEADARFEQIIQTVLPTLYSYDAVQIISQYNERWRHYHNQSHILNMLKIADELVPPTVLNAEEARLLRAMIIFHDVEYKLNREPGWSEHQSAVFARKCLERAKEAETFIQQVEIGVIATFTHTMENVPEALNEVVSFLIDIDLLAGLGRTREEFKFISISIGLEYDPLYTVGEFNARRTKWAEKMLGRERIFLTRWFAHLEETVRQNLRMYIC